MRNLQRTFNSDFHFRCPVCEKKLRYLLEPIDHSKGIPERGVFAAKHRVQCRNCGFDKYLKLEYEKPKVEIGDFNNRRGIASTTKTS